MSLSDRLSVDELIEPERIGARILLSLIARRLGTLKTATRMSRLVPAVTSSCSQTSHSK